MRAPKDEGPVAPPTWIRAFGRARPSPSFCSPRKGRNESERDCTREQERQRQVTVPVPQTAGCIQLQDNGPFKHRKVTKSLLGPPPLLYLFYLFRAWPLRRELLLAAVLVKIDTICAVLYYLSSPARQLSRAPRWGPGRPRVMHPRGQCTRLTGRNGEAVACQRKMLDGE